MEVGLTSEEVKSRHARQWAKASLTTTLVVTVWLVLIWFTPLTFFISYTFGGADLVINASSFLFVIPLILAIISLSKKWTMLGMLMLNICAVLVVLPPLLFVVFILLIAIN